MSCFQPIPAITLLILSVFYHFLCQKSLYFVNFFHRSICIGKYALCISDKLF